MSDSLLYKYVNIINLKHILGGSIRMTQPGAFNDPFELLPEIVVPRDQTERPLKLSFGLLSPRRSDAAQAVVLTSELVARETLINGPTSEVAGEMASNFLDDEANRRSIQ